MSSKSPEAERTDALALSAIGVSFRGVRALDDVTLAIPAGGISAVIGPNGAGKTTLFNCISGIYRHEGTVSLAGRDISHLRAHRRAAAGIARTFQTPMVLAESTVLENVALGAHHWTHGGMLSSILRVGPAAAQDRRAREAAWEMLAAFELRPLAERRVDALAHAERRRVEVARAMLMSPRVLMLDEPAAGLSEREAHDLLAGIAAVAPEGMTTVLVEHDMALVMAVASSVCVLDAGRLIAQGTPASVSSDPAVIAAYLGSEAA
jgi:branched-chain amino acid transport system ATP-binding protein